MGFQHSRSDLAVGDQIETITGQGQLLLLETGWHRLVFSRYLPEPGKAVKVKALEPFYRGVPRRRRGTA